jgi:hypothetical protein
MPSAGDWLCDAQLTGPWLLLHHPHPAAADGAVEVVVEGRLVRIADAQVARLLLGAEPPVDQPPHRIDIPGGNIDILAHLVVVEVGVLRHEIVRHRAAGRMLSG